MLIVRALLSYFRTHIQKHFPFEVHMQSLLQWMQFTGGGLIGPQAETSLACGALGVARISIIVKIIRVIFVTGGLSDVFKVELVSALYDASSK